jgi:hypothetical protein
MLEFGSFVDKRSFFFVLLVRIEVEYEILLPHASHVLVSIL